MAATLQTHLHLGADSGGSANPEYTVQFQSKHYHRREIFASAARALSGRLKTHVLTSAGNPVVFHNFDPILLLTRAEFDTVMALLGDEIYITPVYHDSGDHVATTVKVQFMNAEVQTTDPMQQYYVVVVNLVDAENEA